MTLYEEVNFRRAPDVVRRRYVDKAQMSRLPNRNRDASAGAITSRYGAEACETSLPSAFLRRPAVGLGAGAAHQHGALAGAQAICLEEQLDTLLVVDDRKGTRPVNTPQAALETPDNEDTGERIPDVGIRIRLLRQRAGAAHLDNHVLAFRKVEHLR